MPTTSVVRRKRLLALASVSAAVAAVACLASLHSQTPRPSGPAPRILTAIRNAQRATLAASRSPRARAQFDVGAVPGSTRLQGITLVFNRSAAQQADLQALLAAQQDPSSPQYHQWLTPDAFGARFGMAPADLAKVEVWLQQQGFTIDAVARSRDRIRFSGTAAQVAAAFGAPLHYFQVDGVRHFAPAADLSLPAAIAPTVLAVRNLDDFRPHPRLQTVQALPRFTSSLTQNVFLAPGDIATTYDLGALRSSGIDGTGQTIAVVGQSAITLSDLEAFQSAAGLPVKDPNVILVPNSGAAAIFGSDEAESDLDLEWANAIAPGATIDFVYAGGSQTASVFDALTFAVDQDLAPIVSMSYGSCEPAESQTLRDSTETVLQQAAAQGQTVIAPASDYGSTDCYGVSGLSTAQQHALAVDYPASSAYATAIGGTEMPTADLTAGGTYWNSAPATADLLSSAKSYVPETAWNDDSPPTSTTAGGLSATGGGASAFFAKPAWQAGVAGIPADGHRDVPDLALYASPSFPGYLFCSSDTSVWVQATATSQGQQSSCTAGFRDASTNDLTVAGGTSFGVPIFAGMLAMLNQAHGYTEGQGLINPTLYSLASSPAIYGEAFHDVTTGNNNCTAGPTFCGTTTGGFSAGPGYDQVTGLGSVDLNQLSLQWPANTAPSANLVSTRTEVTTPSATPALNANVSYTITVSPVSGGSTPTGKVTLNLDGATNPPAPLTLAANGTAVYTTTFSGAAGLGPHQLLVEYSGDATHAPSNGAVTVNVPVPSSGTGSFSLAAGNVSVGAGGAGSSTITITPSGGYTGTVVFSLTSSNPTALANLCTSWASTNSSGAGTAAVIGATPVTTQLTLDATAADCAAGGLAPLAPTSGRAAPPPQPGPSANLVLFLLGLLLLAAALAALRRNRAKLGLAALLAFGLAATACGGSGFTPIGSGNTGGNSNNPPAGTYTMTVTGTDSTTSTITASTTFTFTIQ
jgi:subtilase family serine protease